MVGIPLTAICNREYTDPRQRQLFKNIIYIGALTALLDMDVQVVEKLIGEQYKGKEKLIEPNLKALHIGRDYALLNLSARCGSSCARPTRSATASSSRAIPPPRSARSMAARPCAPGIRSRRRRRWPMPLPGIARNCGSIPVTKEARYAIIQAEDELASIGMVIGAGWNGARAFTATSGPGISLMQEFIGLSYFAEIPAVIFNVQRAGPSTGMPTRTQQCDITSCAYASHGDTKHVLLFPEDPAEAFEFGAQAFDLADRLQTTDLRHARPRHRHEQPAVPAAGLGRQPEDRPRQGDDRCGARGRQGVRPLSRRRWRRHPLSHLSRHASDQGLVLHPRHLARPLREIHRGSRALRRQHAAAAAQVRDRQGHGAASRWSPTRQSRPNTA